MPLKTVVVVGILWGLLAGEARGQQLSREEIMKGALQRARRGVATGISVGVGSAYTFGDAATLEVPVSFGLGFRKYDTLVLPDVGTFRAKIEAKVKARIKERIKQHVKEGKAPPTEEEIRAEARQVLAEAKAEVLAQLNMGPKLVEDPSFAVDLEGLYFPGGGTGEIRLTVGFGISKVTIGPNVVLVLAEDVGLTLGGEVALRLLPGDGPRSPNVDLYVRADFGVAGTDDIAATGGVRLLLDII